MKFKSKKDWWLTVIIWGACIFAIGSGIYGLMVKPFSIYVFIIVLLGAIILPLIMLWFWLATYYVITDDSLIIKYGPFQTTIPLHRIQSLKKTRNPLSSPALSLQRIEIFYDKYSSVLISPEKREMFIKVLSSKCPHMKVSN
ncbi:PH domain-containing protein [Niallia sp. Man26]|uniref:PH domain-containing protein n=1 Tax=Niallia sp. Man26 TaxID=2912824 RepID=UPI001EDA1CD7|nr:PH domain-containing protein [Niallia sp. Man26]UPO90695.1 PH domain-containing protein [Niallia sp. Man26]